MSRIKHYQLPQIHLSSLHLMIVQKYIVLDVQDVDARVTFDGNGVSSSNGHILYAGRSYTFSARAAELAEFARKGSSGTCVIHASEFTD